jgi:hypothetical protein
MLRNEPLQILGPASVVGVILCAAIGAHALASWPTSSALWYLNLEVFRSFRYSFEGVAFISWFDTDGLVQSICVAALLSGLIFAGLMTRNRLPFGIASNLSLIYSATLLYSSIVEYGTTSGIRMNLSGLATPAGVLAAMMLALSVWSTAISHRSYWRDIFA